MTTSSARKGGWKKEVDGGGTGGGRTKTPTVSERDPSPSSLPLHPAASLTSPSLSYPPPAPARYALDPALVEHGH